MDFLVTLTDFCTARAAAKAPSKVAGLKDAFAEKDAAAGNEDELIQAALLEPKRRGSQSLLDFGREPEVEPSTPGKVKEMSPMEIQMAELEAKIVASEAKIAKHTQPGEEVVVQKPIKVRPNRKSTYIDDFLLERSKIPTPAQVDDESGVIDVDKVVSVATPSSGAMHTAAKEGDAAAIESLIKLGYSTNMLFTVRIHADSGAPPCCCLLALAHVCGQGKQV